MIRRNYSGQYASPCTYISLLCSSCQVNNDKMISTLPGLLSELIKAWMAWLQFTAWYYKPAAWERSKQNLTVMTRVGDWRLNCLSNSGWLMVMWLIGIYKYLNYKFFSIFNVFQQRRFHGNECFKSVYNQHKSLKEKIFLNIEKIFLLSSLVPNHQKMYYLLPWKTVI